MKSKKWVVAAVVVILLLVGGSLLSSLFLTRERVISALEDRFDRDVELESIRLSFIPPFSAEGTKLVIHQKPEDAGFPPFILIDRFVIRAGPMGLLRGTKIIRGVELEGLEIHVPPRKDEDDTAGEEDNGIGDELRKHPFEIRRIVADGTILRIFPKERRKPPLVWNLKRLRLESVGLDRPFRFESTLRNAVPPGDIETQGRFGPWNEADLGFTPVSGDYTFAHADLGRFKGISGILSSVGVFRGVLGKLAVDGTTHTPDFAITLAGNPMNLDTTFHAIVDGTDGDTRLEPVRAKLGESSIVARGGVIGYPGKEGKTVELDVVVEGGRLEDFLKLGIKGDRPPIVGSIGTQAAVVIPPGKIEVIDKIRIEGAFDIEDARFTDKTIQEKVDAFSERADGPDKEGKAVRVESKMDGDFVFEDGILSLGNFAYAIPGGRVQLDGRYVLQQDELDFEGRLFMDAKLSETTSGIKSFLLKILDPFFRDDGVTSVPVKVTGSKDKPEFGLNF